MKINSDGSIFVLIPTHNRKEILLKTLSQVIAQLARTEMRVFVVDAGSMDGSGLAAENFSPDIEVVKGSAEMWWTATVNHGLSHISQFATERDRIILMNDDVHLEPTALSRLIEASILEPNAIIGAANILRRPNDALRVYFCGGQYDLLFSRHKSNLSQYEPWNPTPQRFLDSDFLYGRLLIIPWTAFKSGNYFDEMGFPQYCADEDFSYNAKQRGFKVLVDTKSVVFVNEETTSSFNLSFIKSGFWGVTKSLKSFNSCYNFRQNWLFARRYAKLPSVYIICRYIILFINENFRHTKSDH